MSSKLITEYVADSINEKLELTTDRIVYPVRMFHIAWTLVCLVCGFRLLQLSANYWQFFGGVLLLLFFVRSVMGPLSVAELTPESQQRLQKFFNEEDSAT